MKWKTYLMHKARLYLILDRQVNDYQRLFEILRQAVSAGADIVQLRDKHGDAEDILRFSKQAIKFLKRRVPFIVNDRVDLACLAQADGVHLGQHDIPVKEARKMVDKEMMIGVSCQTWPHVKEAHDLKADYIGFGSIFKTQTKPERSPMNLNVLKSVLTRSRVPVFPIGGINLGNAGQVLNSGAVRLAVTRAICLSDDVARDTAAFVQMLSKAH